MSDFPYNIEELIQRDSLSEFVDEIMLWKLINDRDTNEEMIQVHLDAHRWDEADEGAKIREAFNTLICYYTISQEENSNDE